MSHGLRLTHCTSVVACQEIAISTPECRRRAKRLELCRLLQTRAIELFGESAEPRRHEQQLVDLVGWNTEPVRIGGVEDVSNSFQKLDGVRRGPGSDAFVAHAAAANHIDAVVAL